MNSPSADPAVRPAGSADASFAARWFLNAWRPYAWILLLALIAFGRSLTFDYVYSDDDYYVLARHEFNANPANVGRAFTEKYTGVYYRPVVTLSLMWDAILGGTHPFMPHLTNLLIHIAVGLVLMQLALRLGFRRGAAFLLAAVFSLHPLVTQSVAWIMGRNDSLAALWVLLSFLFFLRWMRERSAAAVWLHLIFFALALFTKETGILTPVLCAGYFMLVERRSLREFRSEAGLYGGWIGIAVVWFLLRSEAIAGAYNPGTFGFGELIANLPAVSDILGKIFLLGVQSPFSVLSIQSYAFILLLVAWIVWIYREKRNWRETVFGLGWYLIFLAPALFSRLKVAGDLYDYLECRAYLPMIGALLSIFRLFRDRRLPARWQSVLLLGLLFAILIVKSYFTSLDYENRLTYFGSAVRKAPDKALLHYQYAKALNAAGMTERAKEEFRRSIALSPGHADVYTDLADIFYREGAFDEARRMNAQALAINPRHTLALTNAGVQFEREGKNDSALSCWLRAIAIDADYIPAWENTFRLQMQRGAFAEAIALVGERERTGKKLSPAIARIFAFYFHHAAGRDQYTSRNYSSAIDHLRTAVSLRPNSAGALLDLGTVCMASGDLDSAIDAFRRALALDQKNAAAHASLGLAFNAQGRKDAAAEQWLIAAELDTALVAPQENLLRYYAGSNRFDEARTWAERLRRKGVALDPGLLRPAAKREGR